MEEGTYQVHLKSKDLTDECNVFENLEHQSQISEIDLSNNLLSTLPQDLSKYKLLRFLDISNNRFQNYDHIGKSLSTLPKLAELKIDLEEQKNVLIILSCLPKLAYLNGTSTKVDNPTFSEGEIIKPEPEVDPNENNLDCKISYKNDSNIIKEQANIHIPLQKQQEIDVDQNEIEGDSLDSEINYFNSVLQKIVFYFKNSKEKIDKFYADFQIFLKGQIDRINKLIEESAPNFLYSINVYNAKLEIYGYLRKQIYLLMKTPKITANIATLLTALNEIEDHTNINQKLINDLVAKIAPRIQTSIKEFKEQSKETESVLSALNNQISTMKMQNSSLEKENKESESIIKFLTSEKEDLGNQIKLLKQENNKITEHMIKKAKEIHTLAAKEEEDEKCHSDIFFKTNQSGLNVTVGPLTSRIITKKNLLEIIEEIYKSKELYDKKCLENHLPKETLEQHMYSYLNQKYGLKKLILEWATSIINGIKQYSIEDSEICLFGKVLRNELEENIIQVLRKLKTTLKDLIVYCLESKYNYKDHNEIMEMVNQMLKGYLDGDIWKDVTDLLFGQSSHNSKMFKQKVNDYIISTISKGGKSSYEHQTSSSATSSNKKITREEKTVMSLARPEYKIAYFDFFRLLLDFQIRLRSQYLKNFINVFRSVDRDLNGVLNEEQFKELIQKCDIYSNEEVVPCIERLLELIDPYDKNTLTFSDIISTLEKEIFMDEHNNRLNALDKISMNDTLQQLS